MLLGLFPDIFADACIGLIFVMHRINSIKFKTKDECDLFLEYTDKKDFIKRCNNNKGCVLRTYDEEKISIKLEFGECPVCLYDKKLKILKCNHKLCLLCLDQINLHNKLENICPLCQGEL